MFSQNNSNNKPPIPTFNPPPRNDPPPKKDPLQSLDQICRMCRITGDCSTFPFCTKSQEICTYKRDWDGTWKRECTRS